MDHCYKGSNLCIVFVSFLAKMYYIGINLGIFNTNGQFKNYDTNISRASIVAEREYAYLNRSSEQKILALLNLNRISV